MKQSTHAVEMINLMMQPAFCVQDGIIHSVNQEALSLLLCRGQAVADLLLTGREEYAEFSGGCLYLTVHVCQRIWGATVSRVDGLDIFVLEPDQDHSQLQTLALAAQELREPLSSVMTVADRLFPAMDVSNAPDLENQIARINRGLFHMLRLVSNMSDACRYAREAGARMETREITGVLDEIFQKAAGLLEHTGISLEFSNLPSTLFCIISQERLERSIYNILSNAVKFTPSGGHITAKAALRGNKLYLQIQDSGSGIPDTVRGNVFARYLRSPGIEDGRHGIGLGLVLVRATAALHGGTVLMEQPEEGGTRVTMTLSVQQDRSGLIRSNRFRVDYAGERDHGLLELSDTLPHTLYRKESIN